MNKEKIWVIPCTAKVYDVEKHFQKNDTIIWKKSGGIKKGESVYVYSCSPRMAIINRCVVEDDKVQPDVINLNSYAIRDDANLHRKYMKLRKVYEFKEPIPLVKMRELGMYMVRRQSRVYDDLYNYLQQKEAENL